ncbi:hypothetical protein [Serratia ficaria]|uniref:hypothetical protein n=1 Tax=Serratia ficaria TaxID=61651 RepID=UPI0021CA1F6C|nr:hypothetical protein [Serratia ficaria]
MSFYKTTSEAAIQAWDLELTKRMELKDVATTFATKFGAKPKFSSGITNHHFYGLAFPDGAPKFLHPSLWTVATAANSYTNAPRRKAPKGLSNEHKELWSLWNEGYPKDVVDRGPFWSALGLNWGELILCGLEIFRFKDVIYFKTSAKPNLECGAVEITGSEYSAAAEDYQNGK